MIAIRILICCAACLSIAPGTNANQSSGAVAATSPGREIWVSPTPGYGIAAGISDPTGPSGHVEVTPNPRGGGDVGGSYNNGNGFGVNANVEVTPDGKVGGSVGFSKRF